MNPITTLFNFIIHIDKYLGLIIQQFGLLTYLFLFGIIFLETGLVIAPFLPGDSLIFVTGTFAALGFLNPILLFFILASAAILGDSLNYYLGNKFGVKLFEKNVLFKEKHLKKTQEFYKKHGGKTIVFARFIPIIRTFAPFVAGIGKMDYIKFLSYNVFGGIVWVALFLFSGYFFGQIPFVKQNLTLLVIIIIVASFIPVIIEYFKLKRENGN